MVAGKRRSERPNGSKSHKSRKIRELCRIKINGEWPLVTEEKSCKQTFTGWEKTFPVNGPSISSTLRNAAPSLVITLHRSFDGRNNVRSQVIAVLSIFLLLQPFHWLNDFDDLPLYSIYHRYFQVFFTALSYISYDLFHKLSFCQPLPAFPVFIVAVFSLHVLFIVFFLSMFVSHIDLNFICT